MACKECGCITTEKECPNCHNKQFVEKFKGRMYIFDEDHSHIATHLKRPGKGTFAIKYG